MILKMTVQTEAERYLRNKLEKMPHVAQMLISTPDWRKWVELCHARVNQMDIEGFIPSHGEALRFIRIAARAFADKQLQGLILKMENDNNPIS